MDVFVYTIDQNHTSKQTDLYIEKSLSAAGYPGLTVRRTEHGKPYVPRDPVFVSASHTGRFLAVCVAGSACGLDMEPACRRVPKADAVIRRFFSPGERQAVRQAADPAGTFLTVWTKKEALLKYRGEGLSALGRADTAALADSFTFIANPYGLILCVCTARPEKVTIWDRTAGS